MAQTILVTDSGRGCAVSIIRSLGRKGYRVIAADSDPRSLGFRSRYAHEQLLYPPPKTEPTVFTSVMLEAATDRRVDLIIPVTDTTILPLYKSSAMFDGICQLALPNEASWQVARSKHETLELADDLDVPIPRSGLVYSTVEATETAEDFEWPIVLKPVVSKVFRDQSVHDTFPVIYAENTSRLEQQMRRLGGRFPVLMQEYVEGVGQGVELLLDHGEPLAAFQHKRLREIPITGGPSTFRESVPLDPVLYAYSVRLLDALNWTGLAMVEFKMGHDGPKLLEINGRVWGSLPLAVHSGVDFPALLTELHLNGRAENAAPLRTCYKLGVRSRNLELDMMWIVSVLLAKKRYPFLETPNRLKAIPALLGLLNPSYKFDILSLRDPWPGLAEIPKIIRKFRSKLEKCPEHLHAQHTINSPDTCGTHRQLNNDEVTPEVVSSAERPAVSRAPAAAGSIC